MPDRPELGDDNHVNELSDLISTLRNRAPRVAMAVAAIQASRPMARTAKAWVHEQTSYTVRVSGQDDLYHYAHAWILDLVPETRRRSLVAFTGRQVSDGKMGRELGLRYDGRRQTVITINGHRIKVQVTEARFESESREGAAYKAPELVMIAQSASGRDAIIEVLSNLASEMDNARKKPSVKVYGEWGWENLADVPARPLDSVILAPGQVQRIIGDMERFLGAEQEYIRRGIPWHRGYLFDGPPRTGKTSIARALASHFGLDLWYLPLGDVRKDGDLIKKVAQVSQRAVLLLEDVDVFSAATERSEVKGSGGATLAGLLNATDGVVTPHGLITVMTSNNSSKLDSALVQPGRVDLHEKFTRCDTWQGLHIIEYYFNVSDVDVSGMLDISVLDGATPADVVEACNRSTGPRAAIVTLADMRDMPAFHPHMSVVPVTAHAPLGEPYV